MRYFRNKKILRKRRKTSFDFDAPGIINVVIKRHPTLSIFLEIPTYPGQTQIYEVDLSTITANTTYSRISTEAFYVHTQHKKRIDHEKQTQEQDRFPASE